MAHAEAIVRLVGFGTSYSTRRNQIGWSDPRPVRGLIDVVEPDIMIHGKSPGRGADKVFEDESEAYCKARGWDSRERILPCPVDNRLDGPWPRAGHMRNARMYREKRPTVAACWIMGKVGSLMSSGSAGMTRICREGLDGLPPIPLVIYREDGVEIPDHKSAAEALAESRTMLLGLWRAAPWARESIQRAGEAVKVAMATRGDPVAIAAAWSAVEGLRAAEPRLSPWTGVEEAMLGRLAG